MTDAVNTEIVLIDLSSLAYPIWHMSQADPDPNATSTKTVARVRALATGQPHVAVCCDSGRSFRYEITPTYKATRPEHDAPRQHQITLAQETLAADGFQVWAAKGFEADDLIASAAMWAVEQGHTVTLLTADKDLLQLVGPGVRAMSARDGSILDSEGVVTKFGVSPEQMRDYLTLVGDASDNIIGAKGIGPKKAASLLIEYTALDRLYEQLDAKGGASMGLQPSMSASLREFKASGAMALARSLVTLRTDVALPWADVLKERAPVDAGSFQDFDPDADEHDADEDYAPAAPLPLTVSNEPTTSLLSDSCERLQDSGSGSAIGEAAASVPNAGDSGVHTQPSVAGALAVREPDILPAPAEWERGLDPRSMRDARILAKDMHDSRMFSAYGTPQGVLSTVMAGREFGMPAMASLRAFHIIDGKPTLAADAIRAIVLKSGAAKYFRCTERTTELATFETQRGDDPPVSLTYTVAEGRIAFTGNDEAWKKSGWGRNPADLCVARAGAKLARLVYSDVIYSLYATEELD